jgi:molybdenum cofactor biosynthesis enzyme MoaA/dTDP-glucose pyrophosphorylase
VNKIKQISDISAFIVAGGKGARLGDLGKHTQKCMLEFWGKPMLYYLIVLLRNAGCFKIVIAVNHLQSQITDYFKDGKDYGVEIEYVEGNFSSTYDALYQSLNHLSSRILYIHANILFQGTLLENIISLSNQQDKNIIAVISNNNLKLKHAQVSLDAEHNISAIDLEERNNRYPYTFLGVAYYKKQDFITQFDGNSAGMVEKLIQQLLDANIKTLAHQYRGDWRHIETEQDYSSIKQESKWGTVKIIPSLVLNVADNCNMHCIYCPPNGENLCQGNNEYDINAAKTLIKLAKQNHFKTVRLTGGEPLLKPKRLQILLEECSNSFERLVLNTNGLLLNDYFGWLEKYKNNLVLKISLDSIKSNEFAKLTTSNEFDKVTENIRTALTLGFKVEINTVLINQSLEGIGQLIAHYTENKVPIKLLTLSSYFEKVDTSISNFDFVGLVEYLDTVSKKKENEQLNGSRGISMLKYSINDTAVLLVDHSCKSSKTPMKCYFDVCEETCYLFPCDCGVLSISLGTNGILSTCRGRDDFGVNIFDKTEMEIDTIFKLFLKQFENCVDVNVNHCNTK